MSVIIVLIVISVVVALLFLAVFIWAVKSGQFDDTVSPSIRILFDEKKESDDNKNTHSDEEKPE
jgi:cbb3-type cytochrome oxidase maturation protein